MTGPTSQTQPFRILSLDGGGAKGFYTLGVLREIEGLVGCPLAQKFDLIFGTSTGSIIAALLALGHSVEEVHELYRQHLPTVMQARSAKHKSAALARLANEVFGNTPFTAVKTGIGIVATRWISERPMIFKAGIAQAHGRKGTFAAGFGVPIGEAVQASCSAYPFFDRKVVKTAQGDHVELIDGGYCANNPTLYAIADALVAMELPKEQLRVVSVGVGEYPTPKLPRLSKKWWKQKYVDWTPGLGMSVALIQKTFEVNTQSLDQLRRILYKDLKTVRISESYTEPLMATDLFEHDLKKLNILRQRGAESFAHYESELKECLL